MPQHETPRVMIAAPVRNRAWSLPLYLRALETLNYPREQLFFHWIVNDSTDASFRLLRDWMFRVAPALATVERLDFGRTETEYQGATRLAGPRARAIPILAELRNRIRQGALDRGVDYLFSVDTDILVRPDTLRRLLSHQVDVAAALVDNGHGAYNYLHQSPEGDGFIRYPGPPPGQLCWVALTGACCLYSRRALEAGTWKVGPTGEDEGFARCMLDAGFDQWVDGGHQLEHVMEAPASCHTP